VLISHALGEIVLGHIPGLAQRADHGPELSVDVHRLLGTCQGGGDLVDKVRPDKLNLSIALSHQIANGRRQAIQARPRCVSERGDPRLSIRLHYEPAPLAGLELAQLDTPAGGFVDQDQAQIVVVAVADPLGVGVSQCMGGQRDTYADRSRQQRDRDPPIAGIS
jgi:hypothetical protein